jgi:RNA polymerase primary sigma factor
MATFDVNYGPHIAKYMDEVFGDDTVPMTKDEERKMFSDPELSLDDKTHILVQHNRRLISKIAKKYTAIAEMDDLMQEGVLGLHEAVKRFDPNRDVKFCTYAYWYIFQAIQSYLKRENRACSILRNKSVLSLQHVGSAQDGDDSNDHLMDEINSSTYNELNASGVYEDVLAHEQHKLTDMVISAMKDLDILDEREKTVIKHRFLTDKPKTLMEVGKILNLSHAMIKIIADNAIVKIGEYIKTKGLDKSDFLTKKI